MEQFLTTLLEIAVIAFAVSSMLSVGLDHRLQEIIDPLRNIAGVLRVLIANFVLVPLAAYLITQILSLNQPLEIGLLLVGMAAGAPFLVKLSAHAEHDVAMSATLLMLLLPATVLYMPLVIPRLLPRGEINPGAIAIPLVTTMLAPMAAGLFLNHYRKSWALRLLPILGKISTASLVALVFATMLLNFREILAVVGTGAILAAIVLILIAFGIGYALGGSDQEIRGVVGLATAQRNIAAATVVAAQSVGHSGTLVMVVISSLAGLGILFPLAGFLRNRLAEAEKETAHQVTRVPASRTIVNRARIGESLWKRTKHAFGRR